MKHRIHGKYRIEKTCGEYYVYNMETGMYETYRKYLSEALNYVKINNKTPSK